MSLLVLQEAAAGDPARARRRLALLKELPVLGPAAEAIDLSRVLIERGAIPKKAEAILERLSAGETVILVDSGGEIRTKAVCKHMGFIEDSATR